MRTRGKIRLARETRAVAGLLVVVLVAVFVDAQLAVTALGVDGSAVVV